MPLPTGVTAVPVHCLYTDGDGTPVAGRVTFTPSVPALQVPGADTVLGLQAIIVEVGADGEMDVELVATDDAQTTPTGWHWTATERLAGLERMRVIQVPAATVGTLELADLADATPTTDLTTYALQSALLGEVAARIADVDAEELARGNADTALAALITALTPGPWVDVVYAEFAGPPVIIGIDPPPNTGVQVRLEAGGVVRVRGVVGVSGGTIAQHAPIFTVPLAYRPSANRHGYTRTANAPSTHSRWVVRTDGQYNLANSGNITLCDIPCDGMTYTL